MPVERIRRFVRMRPRRLLTRIALAGVLAGVFCTWLRIGEETLSGVEGPNDGWLVVILGALAALWARQMERGSWIGVAGVLGAAIVIVWTAVEDLRDGRAVLGAAVGYGLVLVVVAGVALGAVAIGCAVSITRRREVP